MAQETINSSATPPRSPAETRLAYLVWWGILLLASVCGVPGWLINKLNLSPGLGLEVITQPILLASLLTVAMFLLYLFNGDHSEHHKEYVIPFQGIWTAFSIVTLLATWNGYLAYHAVQDRLAASTGNKTLAYSTIQELQKSTVSLRNKLYSPAASDCLSYKQEIDDVQRRANDTFFQISRAIDYESQDLIESPRLHGLEITTATVQSKRRPLLQVQDILTETIRSLGQISATLNVSPCPQTDTITSTLISQIKGQVNDVQQKVNVAADSLQGLQIQGYPIFLWLGTLNTIFILFPWGLLLLFIYRKRDNRAKQIYDDLIRLDPSHKLLRRVLWKVTQTSPEKSQSSEVKLSPNNQKADNDDEKQLIDQLANQTFSNFEYVLNLIFFSLLIAVGWYYVFYPEAGLNLTQLVRQGGGVRELTLAIIYSLTPLTMGFAGAFFYVIQMLVKRYLANDLYPSAYLQASLRLLTVFILSLTLSLLPFSETSSPSSTPTPTSTASPDTTATPLIQATSTSTATTEINQTLETIVLDGTQYLWSKAKDGVDSLVLLFAFVVGIFPNWGVRYIVIGVSRRLTTEEPEYIEDVPLNRLDGINVWTADRLAQRGIDNIQSLATASIERLVVGTPFSTTQLVDWVDQAILYTHAYYQKINWYPAFRAVGIRTASDLLDASVKGWVGSILQDRDDFEPDPNCLAQIVEAVNAAPGLPDTPPADSSTPAPAGTEPTPSETKAEDKKSPPPKIRLTLAILKVMDEAIWPDPNMGYIINYYCPEKQTETARTSASNELEKMDDRNEDVKQTETARTSVSNAPGTGGVSLLEIISRIFNLFLRRKNAKS